MTLMHHNISIFFKILSIYPSSIFCIFVFINFSMKINKKDKAFEAELIRNDFPILHTKVYEKPLIYFDNASTSQKPKVVINAIKKYYSSYNSNIHRGVHFLSQESTDQFEKTRIKIKEYINASFSEEIIFTKGGFVVTSAHSRSV